MSTVWPLQRAAYARLAGSPHVTVPVYDRPPEGAAMPYVVIGDITETPDDAHDRRGYDATLTIHVWSRYRGKKEIAEILAGVDRALHRQPLPVDGLQDVSVAAAGTQLMGDPDPDLTHGIGRFRVWATSTASITS